MWIDISQTLEHSIAHWPEDTPFSYTTPVTKGQSGSVNIGKIETSTHIGTHIDAPFHFDDAGAKVDELDINRYIGDATVIEVMDREVITKEDLGRFDIRGPVLLVKTKERTAQEVFPDTVPVLDEQAVEYIAGKGVRLFGVDVTSVDPVDSKTLNNHHQLHENDIMIIENTVLEEVGEGYYDFIALPLKIRGADGSPVRAVLRVKEEMDHE
ncbi:MAG TPA: arylformamidase [Candidatus Salinicoccus stercoripullorum]|uniref:Kynurenine formamidase n=1 Tax=Candidatus Salinicoccus stercoripullorum TaxID=2838756 RepID=A0A9D1QIX5_9STAP|nr:arylformamidase [Candidatus Salinicoccus stercoripullorum]